MLSNYSETGRQEFWTVRSDGSDNRREYIETAELVSGGRIDWSWSPDAKAIAWLRTFPGPTVEIIIIDLESGAEQQLTFDRKIIDEVEWTPQNDIIFSSTKSGNTNLWMMPAQGGEAVQITKGSGPDIGMAISSDMKKLLYLQQFWVGNIWSANSDGSDSRQLTFEDQFLQWPDISHDGSKIVYIQRDPDPTKTGADGNIYLIDRDGRNRRQLRAENETVRFPHWSPDDNWLVYQLGFYHGTASVFVLPADVSGRTPPKFIARGSHPTWIDSESIGFWNPDKKTRFRIPFEGGAPSPIYQDSTDSVSITGGDYLLFEDYHKGREGFYVIPSVDVQSQNSAGAIKIGESNVTYWRLSLSRKFLLEYHEPGEIWKVSLPDGKRERLGGAFTNPNIEPGSISFSYDDKEAVYATKRISGKLVLIENFIK